LSEPAGRTQPAGAGGQGRPARHPFLDHPGPIAFAHRGGSAEAPENTYASFARAVSLGYRYLETDVHASADGVVVVCHDPALMRTAGRPGLIRELTWRELAGVRVQGDQPLPRLDEVLSTWPGARFNIDAKHPSVVGPLAEVLRQDGVLDRVCVTSFSDGRIAALRRLLGPGLCTAMGPRAITALRLASLLPATTSGTRPGWSRAWSGAAAAQVPMASRRVPVTDRRFVAAAHRAGLAVHTWTIDDEATMDALLDLGVDGIMTDRPSRLKAVLERRNAWY
jgi:glycerophosphoryl diester phosphodiesterase